VLAEAVDLLEKIVADVGEPGSVPLLQAISDGTFGLMKRPADAGKGLDGVVKCAPGYDNPASTLLATTQTGGGAAK
jgi:beta-lysine 5,6-aminomutase alpha subunit